MVKRLQLRDADFEARFAALLQTRRAEASDVAPVVREIISRVKREGDSALVALTQQFDRVVLSPKTLRFSAEEITQAVASCDPLIHRALRHAADRIRAYHERQLPADAQWKDESGTLLGWRWQPLASAGLYVPGGKASYPSSVLMNAIPASVAGVERMVMVVPTPDGVVNPAIIAAAQMAGVHEIYRIGGAQAVAALAYGTETLAPVVKIVGPGNAYVAEAKRQVFGQVGIDTMAGPSEILVVADARNEPPAMAADLLSQAEHDEDAQAILITTDSGFAQAVAEEIDALLTMLPRADIARASWEKHGAIILVDRLVEALPLIARIAPEHLELAIEQPEEFAHHVRHAGAIFLGRHTPEAIGDYIAGPSHVLPTSGAASFASGLNVLDFMRRTSLIGCTHASVQSLIADAATLADCEGLPAHALSLRTRRQG